ncbi:MAG: DUF3014 domain-containing protein [Woeseia sp.]|nr:DUF3014 domain-containing protein [Woeseia sp.]MBT8096028.1 DUF3014 domain-containing protein [Woeseia sp.]NNE59531.1 DUF3014 domain-containing protein [Woeseia sp.]NNL54376.1 DUF3014 domain-containing protein [Woeseia sp.]
MLRNRGRWGLFLLLIAAGVGFWIWQSRETAQAPTNPTATHPPATPTIKQSDPVPRYPLPVAPLRKPELQPLPALNDSDEYLRLDVARIFGNELTALLVREALIERLVATIDNLPRAQIAERVRPVEPLSSSFVALGQDDSGEYLLGADNYRRYDALVLQLEAADIGQITELYQRYYPLFQKAYEGLGYPQGYFNDRLVEVLDHLIATPDPDDPILLLQPHVLYEYADEDLASLSGGQKLLIRMGPAHRQKVLAVISAFREQVAVTP